MKEKTIDYILRTTWQAVARMYNDEAGKYDVSMAVAFALLSIDRKNGTPSTLLGPNMGMEATSLTRTLKNMEEKNLITRERNPNDGRGVIIKLTSLGLQKRELSKAGVLKFDQTIREHISQEKISDFIEVAEVINQLISEKKIFIDKETTDL